MLVIHEFSGILLGVKITRNKRFHDTNPYLLALAIVEQAVIDSQNPNVKCEHPPYDHTYKDCATQYLSELKRMHHTPVDIALAILGGGDG